MTFALHDATFCSGTIFRGGSVRANRSLSSHMYFERFENKQIGSGHLVSRRFFIGGATKSIHSFVTYPSCNAHV